MKFLGFARPRDSSRVWVGTLPDAGHWLHVDKPIELFQMMEPSFK